MEEVKTTVQMLSETVIERICSDCKGLDNLTTIGEIREQFATNKKERERLYEKKIQFLESLAGRYFVFKHADQPELSVFLMKIDRVVIMFEDGKWPDAKIWGQRIQPSVQNWWEGFMVCSMHGERLWSQFSDFLLYPIEKNQWDKLYSIWLELDDQRSQAFFLADEKEQEKFTEERIAACDLSVRPSGGGE